MSYDGGLIPLSISTDCGLCISTWQSIGLSAGFSRSHNGCTGAATCCIPRWCSRTNTIVPRMLDGRTNRSNMQRNEKVCRGQCQPTSGWLSTTRAARDGLG